MNKILTKALVLVLAIMTSVSCFAVSSKQGRILVANRNDGTVSVIDTQSNQVTQTLELPPSANRAEPMYVVHVAAAHRIFVGDRGNNRVVVFDDKNLTATNSVFVGAGVFHMWANFLGTQLWVTGDVDKSLSVINPFSLKVKTFAIPQDIADQGGKPHDVIVDDWPAPSSAYVSFVGLAGEEDYVVKFNTHTLKEEARVAVAKDPHLSLNLITNKLYIASQQGGKVYTVKRKNLKIISSATINGAHGVSLFPLGTQLYVTDITAANGTNALYQFDIVKKALVGSPVDTGYSTSHNIAQDRLGTQLYITHSGGTSNIVSYYRVNPLNGSLERAGEIQVGLNPFGLAFVS